MLTVLNFAIGITFVYLLFSLVVSALNEFWLSSLDKRADFLKEGLQQLLQDPDKVTKVLGHGLVDALSRYTNGRPSYIGAEPFTAAVLDIIRAADATKVRSISDFKTSIAALPDSKFKQSLSAIVDAAGDPELSAELDRLAAETIKRVRHGDAARSYDAAVADALGRIEAVTELKTAWHPVGA